MSVALRKESVDRKAEDWLNASSLSVALRKESVDRKFCVKLLLLLMTVALRKESVDRKCQFLPQPFLSYCRSPQGERG